MHRFFIDKELLDEAIGSLFLPKELTHQVRDVLRLPVGELLVLLDNSGDEVQAQVIFSNREGVEVELLKRVPGEREPGIRIILCQGLLKSARFEWILEKGTELGISAFVPALCRRSMAGLEDAGTAKLQRWKRIIQEATEQCGRSRLPELAPIRPLPHALNDIPPCALAVMPWEGEQSQTLHAALATFAEKQSVASGAIPTVVCFIGPEGGLVEDEIKLARLHGVQVVTLGSRILRAETAALAAIANVLYELER